MKLSWGFVCLAGLASANVLDKRACAADNCIRALKSRSTVASTDCAAFLQQTSTVTIRPATATVYRTQTITTSTTSTALTTGTQTSSVVVTATVTSAAGGPIAVKRAATTSIPAYASPCSSLAKFSSACSCLGFTAKTTTVSSTLATPSVTISVTSTSIVQLATTSTASTTQFITSTTTIIAPRPTCSSLSFVRDTLDASMPQKTLTRIFTGYGLAESYDNPGNQYNSPEIHYIADTGDDCAALSTCADYAAFGDDYRGHFDLHYKQYNGVWFCTTFKYGVPNANYFFVQDPDVGRGYGYSGTEYTGPNY